MQCGRKVMHSNAYSWSFGVEQVLMQFVKENIHQMSINKECKKLIRK